MDFISSFKVAQSSWLFHFEFRKNPWPPTICQELSQLLGRQRWIRHCPCLRSDEKTIDKRKKITTKQGLWLPIKIIWRNKKTKSKKLDKKPMTGSHPQRFWFNWSWVGPDHFSKFSKWFWSTARTYNHWNWGMSKDVQGSRSRRVWGGNIWVRFGRIDGNVPNIPGQSRGRALWENEEHGQDSNTQLERWLSWRSWKAQWVRAEWEMRLKRWIGRWRGGCREGSGKKDSMSDWGDKSILEVTSIHQQFHIVLSCSVCSMCVCVWGRGGRTPKEGPSSKWAWR